LSKGLRQDGAHAEARPRAGDQRRAKLEGLRE
jgi:hypothetical protein